MVDYQEKLLSRKETAKFLGCAESTLDDWSNPSSKRYIPGFPRKCRHGIRAVGFRMSEILAYLERRTVEDLHE